ncbi:putative peptidase [Actinomycetospora sp. NBRC 106375]|uniref:CocE/NonD family hydrolase n=1 Tax=Actinomycetospora sp. NBRC 106375 TaxID=3032207 RepID=UPI00249FAA01|nr:CocE/NonD family hydrolase [Actinomycetospora sp. NBRC 106375]GLZ49156.1 putative peptidase [Actinomycetospora sp. NBRC 106375]
MSTTHVAGVEPGQRPLNGPQTTGRDYRNLSAAEFGVRRENDVRIPTRDGTVLLADVYRPDTDRQVPALVAAAPYPRQIQDLGAPTGIIEAGISDFWVPRGYAHVIVNLRGMCGSEGTWTFFDSQERLDLHDIVEWVAEQPWCDGQVGMIGISYYAMAMLAAAVERPPHLAAIFPFHATISGFEFANHNGLYSSGFMDSWLSALALVAPRNRAFRSPLVSLARRVLALPRVHRRFATFNGEAALAGLEKVQHLPHAEHPWDDLLRACGHEHPVRDAWWDDRELVSRLAAIDIPVYLGTEWTNVPMHLPGTLAAWEQLADKPNVRLALLGDHGLPWPWESMHVEALAWFDQWLKGRDTGILEGPRIRYVLPGADGWRTAEEWPPTADLIELALQADGRLAPDPGADAAGERSYDSAYGRVAWTTAPLSEDLDVLGHGELALTATSTAEDTGWIVLLEDLAVDGTATPITQGWLRAALREVDEQKSVPGRPILPVRRAVPIPIGELVEYRIPLVPAARRFAAGHRIRLTVTSDDTVPGSRPMLGFTHTPVASTATNTVHATSRLLLPVAP